MQLHLPKLRLVGAAVSHMPRIHCLDICATSKQGLRKVAVECVQQLPRLLTSLLGKDVVPRLMCELEVENTRVNPRKKIW